MNRVFLLGALGYGLLLLGLATRTGGMLALTLLLIVYLGSGLLFGPQPLNLQVIRTTAPERVSPGDPVFIHLTITNLGAALEEVLLEDPLPHGLSVMDGTNRVLTALPAGGAIEIKYTAQAGRGLFSFPGLQASAVDRLGVFQRCTNALGPGQVQVLPKAPQLKRFPIRPRQTRVYSGLIPARQGGSGVDFFGVRQYQPGDPIRRINWRTSARHQESLFSNDFEQERVADVGIILDARLRTNIHVPRGAHTVQGALFEYQVAATAALSEALLRDGNRVGLLVYGAYLDWTYPGYGKIQRERIFQALARARVGDSSIFSNLEYLPRRAFPARSQLILVSPLVVDDLPILIHLRARAYQVLVVSADPVAYERVTPTKHGPNDLAFRLAALERSLLISNLMHAGVQVMDWDVTVPFDQAVNQAEFHLSRTQAIIRGLP
jgi:uncharacterized protein (DUF58 family)